MAFILSFSYTFFILPLFRFWIKSKPGKGLKHLLCIFTVRAIDSDFDP